MPRAWRGEVESKSRLRRVYCGAGDFERGFEFDGLRAAAAGERPLADFAVGDVEEIGGGGKRRAEGEGVFSAGERFAVDFEAAFAVGGGVVNNLAAGCPGWGFDGAGCGGDFSLGAIGHADGPDGSAGFARGRKGDLFVIRRPGGHVVFGGIISEAADGTSGHIEHPDVVAAAERVIAIGGEGDEFAVVREGGFAVVVRADGEFVLIAAVGCDGPEVVVAVAVGEEDDPLAIGREDGLAGVIEDVGDAFGGAAGGREGPDAALEVDGEGAAVGGDGDGHGCAFVDGDGQGRGGGKGEGEDGGQ